MFNWQQIGFHQVFDAGRFDAEHYQPDFVAFEELINKLNAIPLGHIAYINRGVQPEYDENGGVPVLRTVNIRPEGPSETRQDFVSQEYYNHNPRGQVLPSDILMTSTGVGTLGRVMYNHSTDQLFADGHITMIRGLTKLRPLFVTTFLQTRFGLALIERRQRGSSGQIEIYPSDIASIPIPQFVEQIQHEIEQLCLEAENLRQESRRLYGEAEQMLLDAVGVEEFDFEDDLFSVGILGSTLLAGRIDAEFFEAKHKRLEERIQQTGYHTLLGSISHYMQRGVQPQYQDEGSIQVIKSKNIGQQFVSLEDAERCSLDFWKQNKRAQVKQHDVLINSTGRGTLGRANCYLLSKEAVVDGHITIVRTTSNCDPVYLSTFLNSHIGRLQSERFCMGSSGQTEIYPLSIANIHLYLPEQAFQKEVRSLVEQSFASRIAAMQLLEEARRKVEEMVTSGITHG